MTVKEAYNIAKKQYPSDYCLINCDDFNDFWGFVFVPDKNGIYAGAIYLTVNKKDGHTDYLTYIESFTRYESSKPIPLEEVLGEEI